MPELKMRTLYVRELCRQASRKIHNGTPPSAQYAQRAFHLLFGTAAAESRFEARRQTGLAWENPVGAFGLWQMEAATAHDCLANYLVYRPVMSRLVAEFVYGTRGADLSHYWGMKVHTLGCELAASDRLAVALTRVNYYRARPPIPASLAGQAKYWKDVHNTAQGKGSVRGYLSAWATLAAPWIKND